MADVPETTDQGIATHAPPASGHLPGAVDPDASEPQIPRVASPEAGPGDRAWASDGSAARAAEVRVDADGRPLIATMAQQAQQQQAQATPGGTQETTIEGPGFPGKDLDGDDEDDDENDDDEDDDAGDDDVGDDVGGDDEVVQMVAPPELGDLSIEDEDGDTSILGDGHADKAAWNRERIAAMQSDEVAPDHGDTFGSQTVLGHGGTPQVTAIGLGDEAQLRAAAAPRTPGSSEDLGYGGGAPNEDVDSDLPGLDTGDGRLDELADEADIAEDDALDDATGGLDGPDRAPGRGATGGSAPWLPEERDFPHQGISAEERLLADDGEDASFAAGELGDDDDLEMEEMNEIDDIANDFEDQRVADDSMDGNEERTRTRD